MAFLETFLSPENMCNDTKLLQTLLALDFFLVIGYFSWYANFLNNLWRLFFSLQSLFDPHLHSSYAILELCFSFKNLDKLGIVKFNLILDYRKEEVLLACFGMTFELVFLWHVIWLAWRKILSHDRIMLVIFSQSKLRGDGYFWWSFLSKKNLFKNDYTFIKKCWENYIDLELSINTIHYSWEKIQFPWKISMSLCPEPCPYVEAKSIVRHFWVFM